MRKIALVLAFSLLACAEARSASAPDAEARRDAAQVDAAAADAAAAADGGTAACRDDEPPSGVEWRQGGSSCTLPDGRPGIGRGNYGCVDPLECDCKPQAGLAECEAGRCVYAACNGASEADFCRLDKGERGRCCAGKCRSFDFLMTQNEHCGGCGVACASGETCHDGHCGNCESDGLCMCDGVQCGPGSACVRMFCNAQEFTSGGCHGCVAKDCDAQPNGARCVFGTDPNAYAGICCSAQCVSPQYDDAHCGGCGVRCCGGTRCSPAGTFPEGVCLVPPSGA